MIKIIKEGKITRFKKTCPDCGCEFEYETSDLIPDYSVCLTTFPSQYSTYVICPCCGKHIHHGVISVALIRCPKLKSMAQKYLKRYLMTF